MRDAVWRQAGLRGGISLSALAALAAADPACAAGLAPAQGPFPLTAAAITASALIWAGALFVRFTRLDRAARRRIAELEAELNEAEVALTAEPHLLIIWRGPDAPPIRIAGDMRGTARVPLRPESLLAFEGWLEVPSARVLGERLAALRFHGEAFNIGVTTQLGELIEADGRTAGSLATLRLRPLAGERRHLAELEQETRRLGDERERLAELLDGAPFPAWLEEAAGGISWANRAYLDALEVPDLSAAAELGVTLCPPRDRNRPAQPGRALRAHAVIAGAKRALDVYSVPFADGSEAAYAIDVSALEEAEKELKRHIRAHASTLDKLATAIAIFGPDQRLAFYNAAYASLWGLEAAWLDSKPQDGDILDRLREARKLPEQANYRDWRARQLAAYTSAETSENWWHLPDGQTLRVICEQHPFGGVTYLYENVTESLALQSRYNELITVQRETLDNLHEGVALFGSDGRLKLFNPAYQRFWKLDEAFLASQPHIDALTAACAGLLADAALWDELKFTVTALDTARKPLSGRLTRPDGMSFFYASVPLPDGNTLLTYVDVTDSARIENALRERAEALEAADRLKTNFLSTVSYELRTPLTNIIGFAEMLSSGIAGALSARQLAYLTDIQTSSGDLLNLIDAILDLTTIDAGAMELKLAEVNVVGVLEQAAGDLAAEIDKRDLHLEVEIAEDCDSFTADPKRIRQILGHLLSNALGFSSPGGTVRMGARRYGGEIVLWVSDTGKGIDPEFQSRAFEPFQARPAAGAHRGPGLGLALVRSFVELHDGQVSLLSRPNKGTTVICRFPVSGPRGAGRSERRQAAESGRLRQAS